MIAHFCILPAVVVSSLWKTIEVCNPRHSSYSNLPQAALKLCTNEAWFAEVLGLSKRCALVVHGFQEATIAFYLTLKVAKSLFSSHWVATLTFQLIFHELFYRCYGDCGTTNQALVFKLLRNRSFLLFEDSVSVKLWVSSRNSPFEITDVKVRSAGSKITLGLKVSSHSEILNRTVQAAQEFAVLAVKTTETKINWVLAS